MLKIIFLFSILALAPIYGGQASIKKGSVVENAQKETFFLNHGQKVAVRLTGSLKTQFVNKWKISYEEVPKEYKVVNFENMFESGKKKLKSNNKAKSNITVKARGMVQNL